MHMAPSILYMDPENWRKKWSLGMTSKVNKNIWELLFCMPTPEICENFWPSKSSFLTISLHKCPLLTSGIDPAWSIDPPMLILTCFWFVKSRFKAIFNFLTNFWPSKSSIFLVYSHSSSVSHHFPPPLSSLLIEMKQLSGDDHGKVSVLPRKGLLHGKSHHPSLQIAFPKPFRG